MTSEKLSPMFVRTDVLAVSEGTSSSSSSSFGERELKEFGSIALRFPVSVDDPNDNIVTNRWVLASKVTVLVRAKGGGFYLVPLERDKQGWLVRVHPEGNDRLYLLRVELDSQRGCWTVKELV